MNHIFIINPAAGGGRGYKYVPFIESLAKEHGELLKKNYEIELTSRPGDATSMAQKYANAGNCRVYAVGGDGTVNEVLNGLVGSSCEMAVIPAGSGNDFVRSLGCKSNTKDYFMSVVRGSAQPIDAGSCNGRFFLNVASLGIDAQACQYAHQFKKYPLMRGKISYLAGAVQALANYQTSDVVINIDGEIVEQQVMLMVVANAKYYGGGIPAALQADMTDGLFDVVVIEERSWWDLAKAAPHYLTGKQENIDRLIKRTAKRVVIKSEELLAVEYDGEIFTARQLMFEMVPAAIKMVFPQNKVI